jgi:hypothetical protein
MQQSFLKIWKNVKIILNFFIKYFLTILESFPRIP